MRFFNILLPAIAAGLSACEGVSLPESSVDSSYVFDGFEWQGGGGVYVSIKTFDDQGKVALCGAYSASESDARGRFGDLALASMYVQLGGKIITNNIDYFNRVAFHEGKAPIGRAACKRTSADWKPEFASLQPDAQLGKTKFKILD